MKSKMIVSTRFRAQQCPPPRRMARIEEALMLREWGKSAYSGGVYEGSPLQLLLAALARSRVGRIAMEHGLHGLTALALCWGGRNIQVPRRACLWWALVVLAHPASLLSAAAGCFASLEAVLLVAGVAFGCSRWPRMAGVSLGMCASLCPDVLAAAAPLAALASQRERKGAAQVLVGVAAGLLISVSVPALVLGWQDGLNGWLLALERGIVPEDYSPDIGLHWYLGAECFARFRIPLQIGLHAMPFATSLALMLRTSAREPLAAVLVALSTAAISRVHAAPSDSAAWQALLAFAPRLMNRLQVAHLAGMAYSVALALAPAAMEMWAVRGSGNSNHFFAASIVYAVAHCFAAADMAHAACTLSRGKKEGESEKPPQS